MVESGDQGGLAALIERQMGGRGHGPPGPDVRPAIDLYLWAQIGRALREAWSDLAVSGVTPETKAAARRLHRRMMDEAAASAPPYPAAAPPGREAREA